MKINLTWLAVALGASAVLGTTYSGDGHRPRHMPSIRAVYRDFDRAAHPKNDPIFKELEEIYKELRVLKCADQYLTAQREYLTKIRASNPGIVSEKDAVPGTEIKLPSKGLFNVYPRTAVVNAPEEFNDAIHEMANKSMDKNCKPFQKSYKIGGKIPIMADYFKKN